MSPYVKLAKSAVENYIKDGTVISPPSTLPRIFFEKRSGVFVTIEERDRLLNAPKSKLTLRGCIGTYLPTRQDIATEIIYNAIAAATEDPRFFPITEEELPYLSYTVSILHKPELVKQADQKIEFNEKEFRKIGLNPKKYGIIVKSIPLADSEETEDSPYLKTGLLLPNLEDINTVEKQFAIAVQKGNIDPNNEKIIIYRFSTDEYNK